RRAGLSLAAGRLEVSREQPKQHRFPGAVVADDADPLAAQHGQVDVPQDLLAAQRHRRAFELDDALAAAAVWSQVERDAATFEPGAVDLLHAVDLTLLVPRLLDMPLVDHSARPVLEPADRFLEPGDLLLLRDVQLLLPLQLELAAHGVRRVVAW